MAIAKKLEAEQEWSSKLKLDLKSLSVNLSKAKEELEVERVNTR